MAEGGKRKSSHRNEETISVPRTVIRGYATQVDEQEKVKEKVDLTKRQFRSLVDTAPVCLGYIDAAQRFRYVNNGFEEKYGIQRDGIVGKHISTVMGKEAYESVRDYTERVLQCERVSYKIVRSLPSGESRHYEVTLIPDCPESGECESGMAPGYFALIVDNTERRNIEERLESVLADLDRKQLAIHEVVEQAELEIKQIRANIIANVREAILPMLRKLEVPGVPRTYVDLIKQELNQLTSSFGRRVSDPALRLSKREIEICDMIKDGLTSKDIAALLSLSAQTVAKHRRNIRRKLDITGSEVNLATYLRHMGSI